MKIVCFKLCYEAFEAAHCEWWKFENDRDIVRKIKSKGLECRTKNASQRLWTTTFSIYNNDIKSTTDTWNYICREWKRDRDE